ncbi:META domain-containing protein [uncultured Lacinutrix sp.]|uniref:META domain-containing protein n=1 Tax=uncultured Lacinutrix sp. TaxID=574032 RepID=UPI00260A117E|nr:META domain-containing protein [uncultured Lacinutrix sp.]
MKTITILFFTIIFNACGSTKSTANIAENNKDQNPINGLFTVTKLDVHEGLAQKLTLKFNDSSKRVSGFLGCNTFTGSYVVNNNNLTFKDLSYTEKMCEKGSNTLESKMLKCLEKTEHFKIENNTITLLKGATELLTAKKNTEEKMAQDNNTTITYRAHTRGSFKKIILDNKTISVQDNVNGKPTLKSCSNEDWSKLMNMVSDYNLKSLSTLEAPSKAFQYDGAPITNFTIVKDGNTYDVPPFDAGNPHKDIAPLINMVLNIAKETKQ